MYIKKVKKKRKEEKVKKKKSKKYLQSLEISHVRSLAVDVNPRGFPFLYIPLRFSGWRLSTTRNHHNVTSTERNQHLFGHQKNIFKSAQNAPLSVFFKKYMK
jgi:hypothetical protein